jgi:hypothetical protein
MALPNEEREKIIVGSTEPIVSPVINRGLSRLHQNDEYLEQFIGQTAVDSDDLSALGVDGCYLGDKIIAGTGIEVSFDTTTCGKVLRVIATGTVSSSATSGVQAQGPVIDSNIVVWNGATGLYASDSGVSYTDIGTNSADILSLSSVVDTIQTAVSGELIKAATFHLVGSVGRYDESVTSATAVSAWSDTGGVVATWASILPLDLSLYDQIDIHMTKAATGGGSNEWSITRGTADISIDVDAGTIKGSVITNGYTTYITDYIDGVTGPTTVDSVSFPTAGTHSTEIKFDNGFLEELPSTNLRSARNTFANTTYKIECYKRV